MQYWWKEELQLGGMEFMWVGIMSKLKKDWWVDLLLVEGGF